MKSTIVRLILNDKSVDGRILRAQIEAVNEPTVEAAIEKLNAAEKNEKSEIVSGSAEDGDNKGKEEVTVVESTDESSDESTDESSDESTDESSDE